MAYIAEKISTYVSNDTTATPDITSHVAGDYLVVVGLNSGTGTITTPAGWTLIGKTAGNGTIYAFYLKATSSSESAPSIVSSATDDWDIVCATVKDADPTTFINTQSFTSEGSQVSTSTIPSITTTTDDTLVISLVGTGASETLQYPSVFDEFALARDSSLQNDGFFGSSYKGFGTAGIISADTVTSPTDARFSTGRFAINNALGGDVEPRVSSGFNWIRRGGDIPTAFAMTDLSVRVATIAGSSVVPVTGISHAFAGIGYIRDDVAFTQLSFTNGTTLGSWYGVVETFTAVKDFTLPFTFSSQLDSNNWYDPASYSLYFEDSLGNWSVKKGLSDKGGWCLHALASSLTTIDSSGTIDFSDIKYFGFLVKSTTTSTASRQWLISELGLDAPITLVGGAGLGGISGRKISTAFLNGFATYKKQTSAGSALDVITSSVQLGDGSTHTEANMAGSALEFPANDRYGYLIPADQLTLTIKASPTDIMDFRQCIMSCTNKQNFTIDAASSTSATYRFNSATLKRWNATWKTGITCSGATFTECPPVDAKGGVFNNCNIQATTAGATEAAIKFDTNSSMDGTEIDVTSTLAGYHLELGTAVTAFTLTDVIFTGTPGTNKVHVLATTGIVTITTAGTTNLDEVDITTEGAAIAFAAPATTFNILYPNIIDGAVYQIKNTTTDSILTFGTVAGGLGIDETYTQGTNYTAGDNIRIRIAYQSTVTAKHEEENNFTAPASTTINSTPFALTDDAQYNTYGADGSTMAEFSWDSSNIEVNISDADNQTAIQRIGAWYYYFITTATGIDELFGGLVWETLNSIRICTSCADVKVDNTKPTALLLNGGRLYRDDDTTIIAATSNSIQIDYEPVYTSVITVVGSSVITGDITDIPSTLAPSFTEIKGAGWTTETLKNIRDNLGGGGGGGDVNVIQVGGVPVTSPNDLKADLTGVALTTDVVIAYDAVVNGFDQIKGAGWTSETLKDIRDNLGTGGTTPQQVWEYVNRSLTADVTTDTASREASKADVSSLATTTFITGAFDGIKGAGWTSETLKDIRDNLGTGGTTPQQVWEYVDRTITGGAVDGLADIALKTDRLHRRFGLESGTPVDVDGSSLIAGDISMLITGDGRTSSRIELVQP